MEACRRVEIVVVLVDSEARQQHGAVRRRKEMTVGAVQAVRAKGVKDQKRRPEGG
jgi:hypothetical protein